MYKALVHGSDASEIVSVNRPNPDRIDMVSGSTVKAQDGQHQQQRFVLRDLEAQLELGAWGPRRRGPQPCIPSAAAVASLESLSRSNPATPRVLRP